MTATLRTFLKTALMPLGSTMYVYGGGWNGADDGAGEECRRLGVDPRWRQFFECQTSAYDYREHRFALGLGLDCSGYVGWVLYQTLEKENGKCGYVMKSGDMAKTFASYGWGDYRHKDKVSDYRPGDIMSGADHVWISLGGCSDSSVLLIHSSPPGVSLCGTVTPGGEENSMAHRLAKTCMARHFPRWHGRYPCEPKGAQYLTDYDQMRWSFEGKGILTDPEGCAIMDAQTLLCDLFS